MFAQHVSDERDDIARLPHARRHMMSMTIHVAAAATPLLRLMPMRSMMFDDCAILTLMMPTRVIDVNIARFIRRRRFSTLRERAIKAR